MYIKINGNRYVCTGRPVITGGTLWFRLPNGGPELDGSPTGTLLLCQDDGFVLREIPLEGYTRWGMEGRTLTITNLPVQEPDLSALRATKLSELSSACNAAIVAGCDVTLSATTGHISLTDEDQINLTTAVGAVNQGAEGYPYHLDGQLCAIYPAADILAMGEAATAHKLYHTTYCNHLMAWARRATADELEGIAYGAELPADLAANMEAILNAVG